MNKGGLACSRVSSSRTDGRMVAQAAGGSKLSRGRGPSPGRAAFWRRWHSPGGAWVGVGGWLQTQSSEGAWSTSSGAGEHGCGPRHEGVPAGVLGSLAPDLVWLRRF